MRAQAVVLLGLAVSTSSLSRAEVRATSMGPAAGVAVLCDCPPSSPLAWQPVIPPASSQTLNPSGSVDGDQPPGLAIGSTTGFPIAVWSVWDGTDFEIVLSLFDGDAWSPREQVTNNSVNDTDPSVTSREDGSTAVVWRSDSLIPRIQYREREPTGTWSPIVDVSDGSQSAAHPVLIANGGRVRVAYIEAGGGGTRFVKVAGGGDEAFPWPSVFEPEVIAITYWNGELAPGLFSAPSGAISIWTDSSTAIGFSRYDGINWSLPQFEPYVGPEDLERARIRAKQRALRGP